MPRLLTAAITNVELVAPRWRRLRLLGPDLAASPARPGAQLRMLVGPDRTFGLRLPSSMRTYSIAARDGDAIELLVLVRGGDAPGELWARGAEPGAAVKFFEPVDTFALTTSTAQLFVGDETAAPAIAALVALLPPGHARVVLEVDTPDDELDLPGALWLHRGGRPAAASAALADAAAELAGDVVDAYVAGEARSVQLVRARLMAQGVDRRAVRTKPFWTPGRTGLH